MLALVLVIGHLVFGPAPAAAQTTPQASAPREPRAAGPAAMVIQTHPEQPPSPEATMRAFNILEPWVRAWAAPTEAEALAARDAKGNGLPPVYGACVNLRLHGQLIGRGQRMAPTAAAEPDARMIVQAVADAIAQAEGRLPVPNDLTRADAVKLLTPDVQISLELAGSPIPIMDDTWTLIDSFLAPGLDGLMCRAGGGETTMAFPSAMMMSNLLPQRTLRGLIANALGEGGAAEALLTPKSLRGKHGLSMSRFRVSHLAQCKPGAAPMFLFRGARAIKGTQVSWDDLREMADRMATHLDRQREAVTVVPPQLGTLQLATGQVQDDPQGFEQLLFAIHAVGEHQRLPQHMRLREPRPAIRFARERAPRIPEAGVEWCLYTLAAPYFSIDTPMSLMQARANGAIYASIAEAAVGNKVDAAELSDITQRAYQAVRYDRLGPVERSLLLYAAASPNLGGPAAAYVSHQVRRGFAEVGTDRLVGVMPWLGWAELEIAPVAGPGGIPLKEIPSAPALRQMRSEIWKHQLSPLDAGDDGADMVGGIVFTSGNTSPLPTWQCVRPLAFLATMLGDERLTEPAERDIELARLLQAFRFLRQLQVDESCGWMCPNPEAAIGGIRAATWDQTMPPDATSLTLLATCELLKSLDKLAAAEAARNRPVVPAADRPETPAPLAP